MKRFLLYFTSLFVLIVAFALLNDTVCVWLMRHSSSSTAAKMERLWNNPEPDEIPIFGSSRALGNFVPSLISPKCFDYGCNGMGKEEVIFLLQVAAKRKSNEAIIINFDPWQSSPSQSFVGDYRLVPESGRVSTKNQIPGVRFHGSLKTNLVYWLNSRKAVTKVIDHGAEILKNSRSAEEWKVMNSKETPWGYKLNPGLDEAFEDAVRAFAPRKVYVVVGPCSSVKTQNCKSIDVLSSYLSHLSEVCPNAITINFFADPSFTDDDFTDPGHLNITGARKFTQKIATMLNLEPAS